MRSSGGPVPGSSAAPVRRFAGYVVRKVCHRSAHTSARRPLPVLSVTTTSLDGVCGAVCGDACVPGLGVDWRGLGVVWRARVGGWVGFEGVRFVRFVCLSRVSRLPPVSFYRLEWKFSPRETLTKDAKTIWTEAHTSPCPLR
jgi:hypothetical protein